jgi:hypothetical protein
VQLAPRLERRAVMGRHGPTTLVELIQYTSATPFERPATGWSLPGAWCGSWCELRSNVFGRSRIGDTRQNIVAGSSLKPQRNGPSGGGSAGSNPCLNSDTCRGHLVASVPAAFYSELDAIASLGPADAELVGCHSGDLPASWVSGEQSGRPARGGPGLRRAPVRGRNVQARIRSNLSLVPF